jgi:hypothetical protein
MSLNIKSIKHGSDGRTMNQWKISVGLATVIAFLWWLWGPAVALIVITVISCFFLWVLGKVGFSVHYLYVPKDEVLIVLEHHAMDVKVSEIGPGAWVYMLGVDEGPSSVSFHPIDISSEVSLRLDPGLGRRFCIKVLLKLEGFPAKRREAFTKFFLEREVALGYQKFFYPELLQAEVNSIWKSVGVKNRERLLNDPDMKNTINEFIWVMSSQYGCQIALVG